MWWRRPSLPTAGHSNHSAADAGSVAEALALTDRVVPMGDGKNRKCVWCEDAVPLIAAFGSADHGRVAAYCSYSDWVRCRASWESSKSWGKSYLVTALMVLLFELGGAGGAPIPARPCPIGGVTVTGAWPHGSQLLSMAGLHPVRLGQRCGFLSGSALSGKRGTRQEEAAAWSPVLSCHRAAHCPTRLFTGAAAPRDRLAATRPWRSPSRPVVDRLRCCRTGIAALPLTHEGPPTPPGRGRPSGRRTGPYSQPPHTRMAEKWMP
ncbi:hypothetical protein SMICM17S_00889 [Streptomyces microflavus]